MRRLAFRLWSLLGIAAGALLLVWVVRRSGAQIDPVALLASWPLVLAASVWFVVPLWTANASWRRLFPRRDRPPPAAALGLTWIGFGVNWLLPVAAIGGEVVKFRLGLLAGWPRHRLAASLVADKTLQVSTQIVYLLLGAGLLLGMTGRLEWQLSGIVWLAGFAIAVGLFYRAQHAGMFSGLSGALARIGAGPSTRPGSRRIDAAIRRVYRRRTALVGAVALRMAFRLLMAIEIALVIAWFEPAELALPTLIATAIVLESLAQGARAMAFFIPAGLGAQEGALVGAGVLLGLPAETLLIAALVKRGRELAVGVPALVTWQWIEARRLAPPAQVSAGSRSPSSPRSR